jgi:AcrR family transcriptional regulator
MSNPNPALRAARRRMSSDERRGEIVSTAAQLFDDSSFANTTMDDIARRIGVAKPTLYHYFSSKEEILHAIHEEFIDLLIVHHEERDASGLRPEQLLLEAMADILELMQTHRGHVRVFFEHHRELAQDAQREMRAKRDDYEKVVESLIEECVRRGTFRPVNPRLAALALFGMCNWAYQWYRASGTIRPRDIAYQFWNYLVFGLATEELRAESLPPAPSA